MKKTIATVMLLVFAFFGLTACGGMAKKAKIEEKAKKAFALETLMQYPPTKFSLNADVTSFKITKITRDRPTNIAGGFYYVQGEMTIQVKAAEDVFEGQNLRIKKGQVFLTRQGQFRCAAIEDGYGDIVRITNIQMPQATS